MEDQDNPHELIELIRLARGLESEGFYNAAKLVWALLFSEEIRISNQAGIPRSQEDLERELGDLIHRLETAGQKAEVLDMLRAAHEAVRQDHIISLNEVPPVHVCRSCGAIIPGYSPYRCPECGAHGLTLREIPPAYYLEPLTQGEALIALTSTLESVEAAAQGLSEEQMAQTRDGWSLREALQHLLVSQELLQGRIERMLAEENPTLAGVAAWAVDEMQPLSAAQILGQLKRSRQATINRLGALAEADWGRTGQHEEFGEVTILQQASYFAKHEASHLSQIQRIRKDLTPA